MDRFAFGLLLAAVEPRIAVLSLGGVIADDALVEAARKVTVPVEFRIPWNDPDFDRAPMLALFDALGSTEKTLHAYSGRYHPVPDYVNENAARFFTRHLVPDAESASA